MPEQRRPVVPPAPPPRATTVTAVAATQPSPVAAPADEAAAAAEEEADEAAAADGAEHEQNRSIAAPIVLARALLAEDSLGWASDAGDSQVLSREPSLTNLSALAETTDDSRHPPEDGEASLGVSPQLSPRAESTESHDDEVVDEVEVMHDDSALRPSTSLAPPSPSHAAAATAAEVGTDVREVVADRSNAASSNEARRVDGGNDEGAADSHDARVHGAHTAADSIDSGGGEGGGCTEATGRTPGATSSVQLPPSEGAAGDSDDHRTRAVSASAEEEGAAASQATAGTAAPGDHATETIVKGGDVVAEEEAVQAATREEAAGAEEEAVQAASPEDDAGVAAFERSETNPASTTVEQVGSKRLLPSFFRVRSSSVGCRSLPSLGRQTRLVSLTRVY